jgi:hypothetical protein
MYKVFLFIFIGLSVLTLLILKAAGHMPLWGISFVPLIIGISAYIYAIIKYRDVRYIRDTATSKIGSLPIGFVEIYGKARRHPNYHAIYHAVRMTEKTKISDITNMASKTALRDDFSIYPFYIDDDTGSVYVNPENAKIIVDTKRWKDSGYCYEEVEIKEGDYVYCVGTVDNKSKDLQREIFEALKSARVEKYFVQKFDINGDGKISQEEWDIARKKITDSVLEKNLSRQSVGLFEIKQGKENKTFIISNKSEKELTESLFKQIIAAFVIGIVFIGIAIFDCFARTGILEGKIASFYLNFLDGIVLILSTGTAIVSVVYIIFAYYRSKMLHQMDKPRL